MSHPAIEMSDDLVSFVDDQVRIGRHQDANAVIGEALRRYADEIALEDVTMVRQVIQAGRTAIATGDFRTVAGEQDRRDLFARLTRRDGAVAGR